MNEVKMLKKDNKNLLSAGAAVEDFLDTLLRQSTEEFEKPEPPEPRPLKSKILLMPDLELVPEEPEAVTVETDIVEQKETTEEKQGLQDSVEDIAPDESPVYTFPLQCLMFTVGQNQLSIPLIDLGSVLPSGGRLTQLPDSPDWFLGLLQHRERNIKVVDTAKILNIRVPQQEGENRHILVLGDEGWAISCDKLGEVLKLDKEDIQWSKQDSMGLSLGTIRQSLAILLDPYKILRQLNQHQD